MSDVVEQYTIRPIPGSARHGSARGLLPFWFTVNASVYTIGLGFFTAQFQLGLWPTISAIAAGAAVGGAFMAAHSAQGPRLGLAGLAGSQGTAGRPRHSTQPMSIEGIPLTAPRLPGQGWTLAARNGPLKSGHSSRHCCRGNR